MYNKPLFKSSFEAWKYGPVNREIYDEYKKYGSMEIPESEGYIPTGKKFEKELIESVWKSLRSYDAFELVQLTHEEAPWKESIGKNKNIDNNDIGEYFIMSYSK